MRQHPESEHLLVDGYNLIKATPDLRHQERLSLEQARRALQQALTLYAQRTGARITLYFDGDEGLEFMPASEQHPIQTVFSHPPQTADDLIKEAVQNKHGARRLRVISSDREIRRFAQRHKIRSSKADEFAEELQRPPQREKPDEPDDQEAFRHAALNEEEITAWEKLFAEGRGMFEDEEE